MPYRSTEIKSYFGPASKFRHGEWDIGCQMYVVTGRAANGQLKMESGSSRICLQRRSVSALQADNMRRFPSMARGPQICHCEEANGRRGNLGKAVTFLTSTRAARQCRAGSDSRTPASEIAEHVKKTGRAAFELHALRGFFSSPRHSAHRPVRYPQNRCLRYRGTARP